MIKLAKNNLGIVAVVISAILGLSGCRTEEIASKPTFFQTSTITVVEVPVPTLTSTLIATPSPSETIGRPTATKTATPTVSPTLSAFRQKFLMTYEAELKWRFTLFPLT